MKLAKFVDQLPLPGVLKPKDTKGEVPYYEVRMKQFKQKLHRDLPSTKVWGYEGNGCTPPRR